MYLKSEDLKTAVSTLSRICGVYVGEIALLNNISNRGYDLKDGKKSFGFIPYRYGIEDIYQFIEVRRRFGNISGGAQNQPKFLDIGCGIGNIVLLADSLGFVANGLEYDDKTYKIAKGHLQPWSSTIFKGDMRKFNGYGEYDVLYYYQPMPDERDMNKFCSRLAKAMKPGAYVIPHGTLKVFRESEDFEHIESIHVYRKKEKS